MVPFEAVNQAVYDETMPPHETPMWRLLVLENRKLDTIVAGLRQDYYYPERRAAVNEAIVETASDVRQTLDVIDQTEGPIAWTDYFRLLTHLTFIEQRVKTPALFNDQRDWQERQRMTDGLYGLNAMLIEHALTLHDNPQTSKTAREQLRGVIHEQTTLAFFNYTDKPSEIGLPARTNDDLYHKKDIDYWRIESKIPVHISAQVKGAEQLRLRPLEPSKTILVTARDLGNSFRPFRPSLVSARLIVNDVNGTIEQISKKHLNQRRNRFMTTFNERVAAQTEG